jgi:hypothetical protein
VLFVCGAILTYIENGSELSFWIVSFGLSLGGTLLLLPVFGMQSRKINVGKSNNQLVLAVIFHVLAILIALVSYPFRFLSYVLLFQVMMGIALILWTIAIIIYIKKR